MVTRDSSQPQARRKLGRGLSQVSHIFLSGAQKGEEQGPEAEGACLWMPDVSYVSVTSGEKVRGKTFLAANLAFGLSLKHRKVAIVNADSGKPDVLDITSSRYQDQEPSIARTDQAFGNLYAVDVLGGIGPGVDVSHGRTSPLAAVERVARRVESVIIDTCPWAESSRMIWKIARTVIVLARPGIDRMRSSYVTVKRIHSVSPEVRIGLVVNEVRSYAEADKCFRKLSSVCRSFLKKNLRNYGFIFHDDVVDEACGKSVPLIRAFPESRAAECISSILGLIIMDQSAIARRRREVRVTQCALKEGK
jgi:MinD-like ATPase involved in chromosome partitioning or flagellar assembly